MRNYRGVTLNPGWQGWYRNKANKAKRKARRKQHKFQRSARRFGVTKVRGLTIRRLD